MVDILVIGATGFIGHAVSWEGLRGGLSIAGLGRRPTSNVPLQGQITYIQGDLLQVDLHAALNSLQPKVILFAAGSASVPLSIKTPSEDFAQNVCAYELLLEAARSCPSKPSILLLSSAAVYGQPSELPISETVPVTPLSPYGFHKYVAETLSQKYVTCFDMNISAARIFSAYGPGLRRQLLWDLIQKTIQDGPIVLMGKGTESRDFIFIKDLARVLVGLMTLQMEGQITGWNVFNIASGREVMVSEVASAIVQCFGRSEDDLRFSGTLPPGVPTNWRADIEKIASLGLVPEEPFHEALRAYVEWAKLDLGVVPGRQS